MARTDHTKALQEFGKQLAKFRKRKKLSLRELSYACNIDHSRIGKIEKGQINLTFNTIVDLARALEIHPRKLFDGDNE